MAGIIPFLLSHTNGLTVRLFSYLKRSFGEINHINNFILIIGFATGFFMYPTSSFISLVGRHKYFIKMIIPAVINNIFEKLIPIPFILIRGMNGNGIYEKLGLPFTYLT